MPEYELELTTNELLWLLDHTSLFSQLPEGADAVIMQEFRLKLLSSLNEVSSRTLPAANVTLTSIEMWVALETAKTSAQIGTEKVGLSLIGKLSTGLLATSADSEVHSAIVQVGEDLSGDEADKHAYKKKIDEFAKLQQEDK